MNPIIGTELGPEFDQGNIQSDKIRLKLGTGLAVQPDGVIVLNQSLVLTKEPEYKYDTYWAEDSGNSSANGYIYSWGNGDIGVIGVPVLGSNVEIIGMAFQADNGGTGSSIEIRVVDVQDMSNFVILATLSVVESGDGVNNNTHYREEFTTPIAVPDGAVLVFQTGAVSGGVYNGHRVFVTTRTPTGREFITDVTIS